MLSWSYELKNASCTPHQIQDQIWKERKHNIPIWDFFWGLIKLALNGQEFEKYRK
ncbi:MAG: hypothetical protein BWX84_01179 [Verrucomicrobia bacterium ADurb.Bin118]|jgi:hypothetical protein|nr:MAG: hypothetical protein BWX84_01179 [Verrucomicrobia bacterium ADurb.Bin118]